MGQQARVMEDVSVETQQPGGALYGCADALPLYPVEPQVVHADFEIGANAVAGLT